MVEHLHLRSPQRALGHAQGEIERLSGEIRASAARRVEELEQEFGALAEALDARSPLRVLARGYAMVSDATTGRVVRAAQDVSANQRLRVRLARGEITVRAEAAASPRDERDAP